MWDIKRGEIECRGKRQRATINVFLRSWFELEVESEIAKADLQSISQRRRLLNEKKILNYYARGLNMNNDSKCWTQGRRSQFVSIFS